MQTAYDLVYMSAQRSPDHLALVDDRSPLQFTYAQLIEEIDAIAAGLWQRGVRPGMFVATILGNGIEHSVALLALSRIGAVPALLNLRLATPDLVKLTEQGELKGAIIHKQPELAAALAAALPANAPKLCAGGAVGTFEDFAACRGDAKILPPPPKPHPDAPAFIFYTSGTTGLPKGGIIPHRASEHRIIWLATQAGIRFGTHNRALGFMPLSHCVGFYGVFLVTLGFNGTFYVMTMFEPAACLDAIEKHKITFTFAVPTHYHAMTLAPNYSPAKVQSLQHVLYGAAPIEPALVNKMAAEWKATIRHIYGTTETMCSLYHPEPVPTPNQLRPGFYSNTRVIKIGGGPDDRVKPGEEGEVIVDATADTIFTGYLNRPDATAEKLRGKWYYSGDVAELHDNGDLTLRGRVDDMIRSGGESIHPEEVEAALANHPGIKELSVVGVTDTRWGQIVVAVVVRKDPALNGAALDAHCKSSTLAAYKRPKAYFFVDVPLPRNVTNKVLRRVLRDQALAARTANAENFQIVGKI